MTPVWQRPAGIDSMEVGGGSASPEGAMSQRQHTGICVRGLAPVFNITRKRWIDLKAASADAMIAQVDKCPSGALQYIRKA